MVMWRLKSCPRCSGDMFIGKEDTWYQQCIQCAYRYELKELKVPEKVENKPAHAVTKG